MKDKKTKKKDEELEKEIPVEFNEEKDEKAAEETEPEEKVVDSAALKIQELMNENKDLHDRLLRRMAEFENYKRRTENEQANLIKFAAEGFIIDVLPIYDDLERSLNHVNEENKDSLIKGLNMVFDKFGKVLERHGVTRMDALNKEFDFNFHEALMKQESKDFPPDTVLNVLDNGYMYKDKVIKHAKVIVSSAPAEKEQDVKPDNTNSEEEKS